MSNIRTIHYISKRPQKDFERYVLANKKYFFLEEDEKYTIHKFKSPEELKGQKAIYIYMFEVKHTDYTEKEVEQWKKLWEEREIEFISITL